VVVAIVIILAALLLPVLKSTRESGRALICMGNLHQIGVAFESYAAEYGVLSAAVCALISPSA
jgi:type II secretory pathway pseudopilin PulG